MLMFTIHMLCEDFLYFCSNPKAYCKNFTLNIHTNLLEPRPAKIFGFNVDLIIEMRKFKHYTDTQLVLSFQEGDTAALSELIERYKDKIFTSILFLVKDRFLAEDIFQETFIRVIDTLRLKTYKEEGKVLPWMMRIAHNLCVDYFRKMKRMPIITSDQSDIRQIFDSIGINNAPNIEEIIIKKENHAMVLGMLNRLPELQREVVVLRHFADMSFKEIAQLTNCSINTSLGRMRYALLSLKKMVEEKGVAL